MNSVNIPADIDREDRILGGLSARQLVIVIIPMAGLWATYLATRQFIPLIAFAPIAIIIGAFTATFAVGRRDGMSFDRLVLAAIRHHRSPQRLIPATPSATPLFFDDHGTRLGALGLSPLGIAVDGVVDLGTDGAAVIASATSVNLGLRSETEQEVITAAFGRFVNALDSGVQIVVRAQRVDLGAVTHDLERRAPALPHFKLEAAAREHAAFLRSLSDRPDLWCREILVVFRHPGEAELARPFLDRRVDEATSLLRVTGVTLCRLDGHATNDVLVRCTDPNAPAHSSPSLFDDVVQGAQYE